MARGRPASVAAALEALVSIRRRLGRDRVGISRDPELAFDAPDQGRSVHDRAEVRELVQIVSGLITDALTARRRTVMVAVAINGVPRPGPWRASCTRRRGRCTRRCTTPAASCAPGSRRDRREDVLAHGPVMTDESVRRTAEGTLGAA